MIRELLKDADPSVDLPGATDVEDDTPGCGGRRRGRHSSVRRRTSTTAATATTAPAPNAYTFPKDQPADSFALDGDWTIETQYATPEGDDGRISLEYHAAEVRVVVAGTGDIELRRDDGSTETIAIDGTPRSYELLKQADIAEGTLTLDVPPGIQVYSFTFG